MQGYLTKCINDLSRFNVIRYIMCWFVLYSNGTIEHVIAW